MLTPGWAWREKSAIVTPSFHRLSEPVHEIVVSSPWRNRSQRCRVIQRPCPTPLTPRGVAQARALGERLRLAPFDKVFCSELARTGTTADLLLGDRAIPRERHPALNEMFFGDWEMRHHRDLQREDAENYAAWCADWQHAAPTNGESFQNFARRVSEFIPTLTDCRHLDHLLIVGHQGVLSLLTALLLQMPAAAMWHFPIAHGAWSLLEIRDDFTTLRVLNSQAVWRPQEEFPPDH